jgi:hypothetical protein
VGFSRDPWQILAAFDNCQDGDTVPAHSFRPSCTEPVMRPWQMREAVRISDRAEPNVISSLMRRNLTWLTFGVLPWR